LPPIAFLLLLVSAVLHTSWNLLLKTAEDKYIASWATTALGALIVLPLIFFTGTPPRSVWGLLVVSASVEAAYFISLSYAYHDNDLSLVYPIARGAAPALIFLWASVLLGEQYTAGGLLGLALIVAGLSVIGLGGMSGTHKRSVRWKGIAVALLTAVCISVYTVVDGAAVKRSDPIPYVLMLFLLIPLLITPLAVRRYGWTRLAADFRTGWRRFTLMAALGTLAYALVLFTYHIAPVGYAGSVREMSVVLAALAGWQLLGEGLGAMRAAGAAIVFAGILLVAALG
jgi:drug/metabolite transporter (DMT)-like permease